MDSPLRLGVIGYGLAGSAFHAPVITAEPDLTVAAILVGNPARQIQASERYPTAEVVAELDAFLELNLDAVVVATPNHTHFELTDRLLDADISVVVDKPMTTDFREAKHLVKKAERRDLLLCSYQNRRFDGDFLTVQQLLASSELGSVFRFESRFERFRANVKPGWKEEPGPGAGILWDLGPHLIDQAIALFGPPVSVYSEIQKVRPDALVDDSAFVALEHSGGETSHLSMSAVAGSPGPRFRVLGTSGAYVKHGLDPQEDALRDGGDPLRVGWGRESVSSWGEIHTGNSSRPVPTTPGNYREFYQQFAAALRGGGPVPMDPADTLRVIQIIEDAHAADA